MKTPMHYTAIQLKHWSVSTQLSNGFWTPARPEGWSGFNLIKRIKAAWIVFTGKVDVLIWSEQ